jgi:hypothetical protein
VEILGDFTDSDDKSITTAFKILKEINPSEIEFIRYEENLNLDLVKEIQKKSLTKTYVI